MCVPRWWSEYPCGNLVCARGTLAMAVAAVLGPGLDAVSLEALVKRLYAVGGREGQAGRGGREGKAGRGRQGLLGNRGRDKDCQASPRPCLLSGTCPAIFSEVLCCAVLCCAVLCCAVLCCVCCVLCCAVCVVCCCVCCVLCAVLCVLCAVPCCAVPCDALTRPSSLKWTRLTMV